ncbi:MAG: alpha/beta hydrolase [Gordonia sp. (in: high G+C Gram-positive bacteria)]|uniref:alpha/beta hydrolase n=1 Tax=Gordonia sp. (in: high G+C Gram-positive bacteria) TaxID=84139 RepID=UPI0039E6E7BB
MTSIAAIRGWPLDEFAAAVQAVDHGGDAILDTTGAAQIALGCDPEWTGATRRAVIRRMEVFAAAGRRAVRTLSAIGVAGRRLGAEMESARSALLSVVDSAVAAGFVVADDGVVTHRDPRRARDAEYLTQRITPLLCTAGVADEAAAAMLDLLAGTLVGSPSTVPDPGGGWTVPAEAVVALRTLDPVARRRYWDSLTAAEVQALIDAAPDVVGGLDGVSFDDRIAANAVSMRRSLDAEVLAGRGDGERAVALRALSAPVEGPDGRFAPRRFLTFDDAGGGRYIEVVGELAPDTRSVGVYVPGTGSRLATIDDDHRRATALAATSGAPVLLYVDGDFPQQIGPASPLTSGHGTVSGTAMDPRPAREIGARLAGFGRALDVEIASRAPGASTTFIGHSYGGSIVGTAEQYGLRADNIVFASSAGTGAADGPWRDPNPDVHRYSLTPPGDPIHWAQKFGGAVHGGDPDSAPGVQRLDTGSYSPAFGGGLVEGLDAHGGYLDDPESTAFTNIAAVLAGRPPTPYVERAPDFP